MTGLRRARLAREWSQTRAIAELAAVAAARGVSLPGREHLKTQLSRWENGRVEPGAEYQALWSAVYGLSGAELGFRPVRSDQDHAVELITRLAVGRSVGSDTVRAFLAQIDEIRALDRSLGAPATHSRLFGLVEAMRSLLSHTVLPRARAPLAGVLADATALAGWQALDLGDLERAWQLHEMSKGAARESENTAALAHAMAEQACVLIDLGCNADAVALVRATREMAQGRVPRILESWILATEAEACAAAGDVYGSRSCIEKATDTLPASPDEDLPYVFLEPAHMRRWRGNVLARIGDPDATDDLLLALAGMDSSFIRATAGLECDIAIALTAQGERAEARQHAARARELARRTGSVRHLRRLQRAMRAA